MAKLHGDFGDLSRYDVLTPMSAMLARDEGETVSLYCQDCDAVIETWPRRVVNLADLARVAAEHETREERDDTDGAT